VLIRENLWLDFSDFLPPCELQSIGGINTSTKVPELNTMKGVCMRLTEMVSCSG